MPTSPLLFRLNSSFLYGIGWLSVVWAGKLIFCCKENRVPDFVIQPEFSTNDLLPSFSLGVLCL